MKRLTLLEEAEKRDERLRVIIKTARAAADRLGNVKPGDTHLFDILKQTRSDIQFIEMKARAMFPNIVGAKL